MAVQPGLCRTWSETPKTGFLTTRLICLRKPSKGQNHVIKCMCLGSVTEDLSPYDPGAAVVLGLAQSIRINHTDHKALTDFDQTTV